MTSFNASSAGYYHVLGDRGQLCVDSAYDYAMPIEHDITINGKQKHKSFSKRDQFAPELLHFSECILNDYEPEPSGEEGLIDVRIIEALYRSAREGRSVQLSLFSPDSRPSMALEIKSRAHREPGLIHAHQPTDD